MKPSRLVSLAAALLLLAACASPYEKGKSVADVPSHVDVIGMKAVYMADNWKKNDENGDEAEDKAPSQNDQEVVALAKARIISQFTNFGYKIVEGDAPSDIQCKFFIYYQPERWPLVDRQVTVIGRFYDAAGTPLFHVHDQAMNPIGLIGMMVMPSRDDMVADASSGAVKKAVDEMRKGTLDNKQSGAK